MRPRYDVIVVGARCAGAATAMLLARHGLAVLVVDRGRYGTDTLSTHALMRGGVLKLHHWSLLDQIRDAGTPVTRSTAFHYGDEVVNIDIRVRDGIDGLYSPRRFVIDKVLVDAARDSGADVIYETTLIDLRRSADGRVTGAVLKGNDGDAFEVSAGLVVGADGMRSKVASLCAAPVYRTGQHCTGVVFSYWDKLGLDGNHWYYRPGVSAGAIPTNDGKTCVFAAVSSKRFEEEFASDIERGYHHVIRQCDPGLAAAIERSERTEKYRGFAGQAGFFRQSWGPGWALVGDAGYFKDPITAHGISDAFIDAEVLAQAIATASDTALADYQDRRDERASGLFETTDSISSFDWNLPEVQQLHHTLSREMKRECAELLER